MALIRMGGTISWKQGLFPRGAMGLPFALPPSPRGGNAPCGTAKPCHITRKTKKMGGMAKAPSARFLFALCPGIASYVALGAVGKPQGPKAARPSRGWERPGFRRCGGA